MFGFPAKEYSSYNKNFLKIVVIEFKYAKSVSVIDKYDLITDLFKVDFPRFKKTSVGARIKIDGNFIKKQGDSSSIHLRSEDGREYIEISDTRFSYSIDGNVYKNYTTAKNRLSKLLEFLAIINISQVEKITMRKINIIDFQTDDNPSDVLKELINNELIGNLNCFPNTERINHNIQSLNYQINPYKLNINYGLNMINLNDKIGQIIADIELMKIEETNNTSVFSILDKINKEVYDIFHWIISEKTRHILNE